MRSVLITGCDRGLGLSLAKEYLARGFRVFAGRFEKDFHLLDDLKKEHEHLHPIWLDVGCEKSIAEAVQTVREITDSLDMFISNAALMGKTKCDLYDVPMNLEDAWNSFRVNAMGPLMLTDALLPLLAKGEMKRLCYVSSEVACLTLMRHRGDGHFPYPMSKSGMQMGIRMMHNQLHPGGYTFRLFHPGWMKRRAADGTLSESAKYDPDYIGDIAARYFVKDSYNEQRLVMVDYSGYEWPC
jgi:NAD(P)-dependent dehydrogenase (short-subunit alcohol dehydrogenase family)